MNLFQIVFLYVMLLIFPMLVYLIYLSTNKNINLKKQNIYLTLTIITSFFLTYNYGVVVPSILPILILNSLVIFSYLNDKYILANILSIGILLLYSNSFNFIWILSITYIVMAILYLLNKYFKISNFIFIELLSSISSFIYYIWMYKYNNNFFEPQKLLLVITSYFFIVNIICFMYETGKKILETHITFKELQKEKQIRVSLFKITHEIKNPIAVCKGYLDMININDQKQVNRYIPIIKSEIERLISLLQDFLLINKNNLTLDVMDLNMLVEDTLKTMNSLLSDKRINLNLDMIDDEIFINGDYNRLSQVIINLVKNSIESIPNGKEGIISISTKIKNNKYQLVISDNGIGMTKDILSKIKEPFYTTKKRGSGLGVSLIYEIVEAHKGKINYESEYGKGTKVTLQFPLYE